MMESRARLLIRPFHGVLPAVNTPRIDDQNPHLFWTHDGGRDVD